jgi:hypothetical protein
MPDKDKDWQYPSWLSDAAHYMAPGLFHTQTPEEAHAQIINGDESKPLPGFLGKAEDYVNNKVIAPFRNGLDNKGRDLEDYAAHASGLTPLARGLVGGTGKMMEFAPIGHNVRETALANLPMVGPEINAEEKLALNEGKSLMQPAEEAAENEGPLGIKESGKDASKTYPLFSNTPNVQQSKYPLGRNVGPLVRDEEKGLWKPAEEPEDQLTLDRINQLGGVKRGTPKKTLIKDTPWGTQPVPPKFESSPWQETQPASADKFTQDVLSEVNSNKQKPLSATAKENLDPNLQRVADDAVEQFQRLNGRLRGNQKDDLADLGRGIAGQIAQDYRDGKLGDATFQSLAERLQSNLQKEAKGQGLVLDKPKASLMSPASDAVDAMKTGMRGKEDAPGLNDIDISPKVGGPYSLLPRSRREPLMSYIPDRVPPQAHRLNPEQLFMRAETSDSPIIADSIPSPLGRSTRDNQVRMANPDFPLNETQQKIIDIFRKQAEEKENSVLPNQRPSRSKILKGTDSKTVPEWADIARELNIPDSTVRSAKDEIKKRAGNPHNFTKYDSE